jgi:hypothetical protein
MHNGTNQLTIHNFNFINFYYNFTQSPINYLIDNFIPIKDDLLNPSLIDNLKLKMSYSKEIGIKFYKDEIIPKINKLNNNEQTKCKKLIIYMNKLINIIIRKEIPKELSIKDITEIFSIVNNYLNLETDKLNQFIRHTIDINFYPNNNIYNYFKTGSFLDSYSNSFIVIMKELIDENYKKSTIWNIIPQNNRIIELCSDKEIAYKPLFIEMNKLILSHINLSVDFNLRNFNLKEYYNNNLINNYSHKKLLDSLIKVLNLPNKTLYCNFFDSKEKKQIKISIEFITQNLNTTNNDHIKIITNKSNKEIILNLIDPITMDGLITEKNNNWFILKQPDINTNNNNINHYHLIKSCYIDNNDFLEKINEKHPITRANISYNEIFSIKSFFYHICNNIEHADILIEKINEIK